MAKLTSSVDNRVVSRAKQYAERRGVSVSQIVVGEPVFSAASAASVLRSLRGVLKGADIDGYRRHLVAKYR